MRLKQSRNTPEKFAHKLSEVNTLVRYEIEGELPSVPIKANVINVHVLDEGIKR